MKFWSVTFACLSMATAAVSETCPASPDHTDQMIGLLAEVREAKTEREGRAVSDRMWALWVIAPDTDAQELLDTGMSRREIFDFDGASKAFDALIAYCPDYAEGWNQRACVNFLRQDFEKALVDLDQALLLTPVHIGALSGKALTLLSMGESDEGQRVLRDALALNPWLQERAYLQPLKKDTF